MISHISVSAPHEHILVGFIVSSELQNLVGNGIEGFIPGDGDETRVSIPPLFWVGPFHGRFYSVRIIDLLKRQVRSGAARFSVDFRIGVPPYLHGLSIHNVNLRRAPGSTALAG